MQVRFQVGNRHEWRLARQYIYEARPSYYVYAGLVFSILSKPYLQVITLYITPLNNPLI